ncbi:MAG: hypothetical protein M0P59_15380 [Gallionella sp.]|jgi:hypothetical protein|nr:hypothetical protein [Gallionella sp.]
MQKRNFYIGSDVFGSTDVDFPNDNFGKLKPLELRGKIQVPDGPTIVATLIETGLKFEDWCEPDLLVPKETNIKGHFWTVFDDSAILTVGVKDGYFKLRRL